MYRKSIIFAACLMASASSMAQERSSSSINLKTYGKSDVMMMVDLNAEGKRFSPVWGLDLAWINEQNLRKGLRHMGASNVGIGRTAFRFKDALINGTELTQATINTMSQRSRLFDIVSPTLPLLFTADQEAGTDASFITYLTKERRYDANVEPWAENINSHVKWMKENTTHPIIGVSPFNEPDYWNTEEGATIENHALVAKRLKENYPLFSDIAIVGGNTLNDDKAKSWFEGGKDYYDWGNTHQLAGSFKSYADFFSYLSSNGKVGYADEMHNVAEAMVGLEYGMTYGIWWGFDSRARGEFCDISRHGKRLAYAEQRDKWTAASIYKHDDGRVKAFIGSSERQANTTSYQFLSPDRDFYYDGQGPLRSFCMVIPGGTTYQEGQVNAERVIDITWGEDVQPAPINGTYQIMNEGTGTALAVMGDNIVVQKYEKLGTQKWNVTPAKSPETFGDFSFYDITGTTNAQLHMNVLNFSTLDGADVIVYKQNAKADSNEQWYLEYAGNGTYYIRNRETSLYLTAKPSMAVNNVNVQTNELMTDENRSRQLWRFLPVTATFDRVAPSQPQGLVADALPASVRLSWDANNERDLDGYMILRAEKGSDEWNTIARKIKDSYFVDNTCMPSTSYIYKVKAIDLSENVSEASEVIESAATGEKAMIARWHLDTNFYDETPNMMDAVHSGTPTFAEDADKDLKYITLTNGAYMQLPYNIANNDEMTISLWINMRANSNWQRVFDFGYDTDHYMFLTTNNGNGAMRFAIKNGGDEQTLDATQNLTLLAWKYLTVSIGKGKTAIYIDGEEVGSSNSITIKPSDLHAILNYVCRSQFNSDPYMPAYIYDMRIYNYAVDAAEVREMMNDKSNSITNVSDDHVPTRIYGIDGTRLTQLQHGINIVDGKKVMIK